MSNYGGPLFGGRSEDVYPIDILERFVTYMRNRAVRVRMIDAIARDGIGNLAENLYDSAVQSLHLGYFDFNTMVQNAPSLEWLVQYAFKAKVIPLSQIPREEIVQDLMERFYKRNGFQYEDSSRFVER